MNTKRHIAKLLIIVLVILSVSSCIRRDKSGDFYARRGINLYKSGGDELKIIKYLKHALKLKLVEYDKATVYTYLGAAYDDLSLPEKAKAAYEAAIQDNPHFHTPWSNLGLIFNDEGNLEKARECYEKALDIKPDYAQALNNLGLLEFNEGNNAKAIEYYEKGIKSDPSLPYVHSNLSLAYATEGRFEDAQASLERAVSLGYKNSEEIYNRIEALRRLKK